MKRQIFLVLCSILFDYVLSVNYGAGDQQYANYGLSSQYYNQAGYKGTQQAYSGGEAWEQSMGNTGYNKELLDNHYNQVKQENYYQNMNTKSQNYYQPSIQSYSGKYSAGYGNYNNYYPLPVHSNNFGSAGYGYGNHVYSSGGYGYGSRHFGHGNAYGVHYGVPVVPVVYGGGQNFLGRITGGVLSGETGKFIGTVALGALILKAIH